MERREFLSAAAAGFGAALSACSASADQSPGEVFEVTKTDAEWRKQLNGDQYQILRKHWTESPGTSPLNNEHRRGTFFCAGCDQPLFSSDTKFDSGTGWPSFYRPLPDAIGTTSDRTLGMIRTEVHCHRCGGHLGHVFDDGPPPTGLRYCMNGGAMVFRTGAKPSAAEDPAIQQ
jgi:peptide-methionine (R)-S-oxide reductase